MQEEKETTSAELVTIEGEIEELKETLVELQEVLVAKNVELDEVRKKGGNSARVLDKAMKEIAACVGFFRVAIEAKLTLRRRTTRLRSCRQSGSLSTGGASSRRLSFLWRRAHSTPFRSM